MALIPDLSQLNPDEQIQRNLIARPDLRPGVLLPPVGPPPKPGASQNGSSPVQQPNVSGIGRLGTMPDPAEPVIAPPNLSPAQSRAEFLRQSSSGIEQLHPKSTIGKIGKDVLRVGDALGSIAAPGVMANIPGTTAHHNALEAQAQRQLGAEVANEEKQASAAKDIAEAHKAQTEANAPAGAAATTTTADGVYQWNPESGRYDIKIGPAPAKTGQTAGEQTLHDLMTGDNGQPRINPATKKPYTYLEAYNALQKPAGNFEEQAYQEWKRTHPSGTREEFARQHATDVRAPREGSWITLEDAQGNPVLYNPVTRQTQTPPAGFKAKGAGHVDAATKEKILTYWQPALDSAERFNVMARNYQDAVKDHDQQAMLSLLANHLGMTMGLQKGSRLTRDIIHEAEQSRPWLQGLQAKFDKNGYLTGVVLTPQQMAQMMTLAEGRYSQDVAKARSMAGYVGVTDEPERKLSREGAAYYLSTSNGDKQKARDAARADGWQF